MEFYELSITGIGPGIRARDRAVLGLGIGIGLGFGLKNTSSGGDKRSAS